jgi:predicted amidohydrolase YtcJ
MRMKIVLSACLLFGASAAFTQLKTATVPDEIFYNGKILTVDSAFTIQQAFAVRGSEILAVGPNAGVRAMAGPATRMTDLKGHTVVPGFMDNHNHQHNVVLTANWGVKLDNVTSITEMVSRLKDAARAKPATAVIGAGGWVVNRLAEKRTPTRQDLDQVSAESPVVVFQGRGTVFVNSAALKALGVTRETKMLLATPVTKDASGEPTGQLNTPVLVNAVIRELLPPPSINEVSGWLEKVQHDQNARGLTSIRDLDLSPAAMRAYFNLRQQKKLTMRISMGIDMAAANWDQLDQVLSSLGFGATFGDDWLRFDGLAEFAVDTGSGLFREPMLDGTLGASRITPDQMRQAMITMNRYGWRPAPHISADGTLDHVLAAYEAANAESSIRDKRWIVEHIPYVQPDQMDRMARLGVLVSVQFQGRAGTAGAARTVGAARAGRIGPVRELLDHKLMVSSGSDWSGGDNNNPFENIYFYVTRKAEDGSVAGPMQKISREEAVRMVTINNAYFTFEEDVKGSLEPGKVADFLILSDDVMSVAEDKIIQIKPLATYVAGRKVYSAPQGGF